MIEKLLVILICGLAFLLAITPARNSDLWLHLALGRGLSAGRLPDGTDPFSSTTQGVYWVNHTWLSDLLFFKIYQIDKHSNGTMLVVGKALLTVFLAVLLFCFRRRGGGMGVLPFASLAAMLALGPWLQLQSFLFSLLGVLLTLYLLERPDLLENVAAERARTYRWLLLPLFALWANLDGWFVLGPILVGLYALGELLRRLFRATRAGPSSDLRALVLLTLAGLAACLATPYHYHIFAWPTPLGLTHTEQALRHDPLGQTLVLSSFARGFAASAVFRSPGAWAYYFLLAASAASFVLSLQRVHTGRLLVWSALAALSIYQARAIPFFAVAAAPFLALNVQEWSRSHPFSETLHRVHTAARRVGVLIAMILLVLAWPGWLQPAPYHPRGWSVESDGSLVRLAEQLKRFHAEDRFSSDRFALNFSPEVAHHLAWFCPEEKGFVDSRWPLFDRVADDYVRMRRCLLQQGDAETDRELASLLKAHRIDRILLHDTDWKRVERAFRHLFQAPTEWELLAVEGGATFFRRRTATASSPEPFDYRLAAYHPALDSRAPPPPRPPQAASWFHAFPPRSDDGSVEREEAALHLLSFDLRVEELAVHWRPVEVTGLIGCGSEMAPAATAVALAARLHFTPSFLPSAPEPLLLAVRAARRALAVNPDDAGAFLLLGEAYLRLARQTREPNWQTMLAALASLRQTQILTALEQAVLLRPELDQAHSLLAQLYYEEGQMDRCLDHLRARLRIAEQERRDTASIGGLRQDVQKMEKLVSQSEKTYQANVAGKTDPSKVLERARLAARHGLTHKALGLMLESYPAIFGKEGVQYQLDLMLQAGQGYQVRDWLKPQHEAQLDFDTYHWVKARAAASCGDYAAADAELDRGSDPLRRIVRPPKLLLPVRSGAAFHVAQAVLTRPVVAEGGGGVASAVRIQLAVLDPLELPPRLLRQEADRQVLRGLLAVESGAIEKAQKHFRAALELWRSETAAATGAGLDFPSRPIAQQMLRRIQE